MASIRGQGQSYTRYSYGYSIHCIFFSFSLENNWVIMRNFVGTPLNKIITSNYIIWHSFYYLVKQQRHIRWLINPKLIKTVIKAETQK